MMANTKIVTEQDLKDNPDLIKQGVMVGDEIPETFVNTSSNQDAANITTAAVSDDISSTDLDLVITSERITTSTLPTTEHPNSVVFEVKYKKGYEGEKTMPVGKTIVSREVAEHFESIGIGSIVK